jgi:hypothetical protein
VNFCSRVAQAQDAVLAGTGVRGDAYVLVPAPKRFWGEKEMNTGWATAAELDAVAEARRRGVVTRLYNPRDGAPSPVRVHRRDATAAAEALPALLEALSARGPIDEGGSPTFAVCTHGQRDRCCAKWGFAVYREALRLFESGVSPYAPLECSHLGGDRFAATGILFPSGGMYGHLDQVDLEALFRADAEGRILPRGYRGRVFDSGLVQVVRAGLARDGYETSATAPISVEEGSDGIRAAVGGRTYVVSVEVADTRFFPSCTALDADRASLGRRTVYAGAKPLN